MNNIYYSPEKFNLTPVAEIEYTSGSYEFDTRVVWRNQSGEFFTARDSGCSCPIPFDTYDLSNIERLNLDELRREVQREQSHAYSRVSPEAAQKFLRDVEIAWQSAKHSFSYIGGQAGEQA